MAALALVGGSWLWTWIGRPDARAASVASVFEVDVAGGPTREESAMPSLDLARGMGRVRVHFIRPALRADGLAVEVRTSSGAILPMTAPLACESGTGRCEASFDAARFEDPGAYELIVRGGPGEEEQSYRYPFVVSIR